jgi:hypothetical protein
VLRIRREFEERAAGHSGGESHSGLIPRAGAVSCSFGHSGRGGFGQDKDAVVVANDPVSRADEDAAEGDV